MGSCFTVSTNIWFILLLTNLIHPLYAVVINQEEIKSLILFIRSIIFLLFAIRPFKWALIPAGQIGYHRQGDFYDLPVHLLAGF